MGGLAAPASAKQALAMLEAAWGFLADMDAASMPAQALAESLQGIERADAVEAAARGRLIAAFSAQDGSLVDGQPTTRAWLVNVTRAAKGQSRGRTRRAPRAVANWGRVWL